MPGSSYSALAACFFVEAVYDATIAVVVLGFAFTQGVFPKPPDFSKLNAFDLSYFAQHPKFALFTITALAVLALAAVAILSARVRRFWERVKQGLTILYDRRRYFREVWGIQFIGWLCRFSAFWFLLEAFHIGGSVHNVLLVLGVNAVAAAVPFTPGGAGVQQAFLVKVFAGTASGATVAPDAVPAKTFTRNACCTPAPPGVNGTTAATALTPSTSSTFLTEPPTPNASSRNQNAAKRKHQPPSCTSQTSRK